MYSGILYSMSTAGENRVWFQIMLEHSVFIQLSRFSASALICLSADEVFCEMVKSNRLCEKKLYRQFCCRTCLMNG